MKKKIVLWGNDENDKKILIAVELKDKENKVNIYTFDEAIATEEFYNQLMDQWRSNKDIQFPEGHQTLERPLTMTDDLLPETIKVQRTDLITRAKTEWHFAVLSAKLYEMYHSELSDIKEKADKLLSFDNGIWDEMIGFWNKLSEQIKERNLFREQADKLRDQSNGLFDQLKELRKKANEDFAKISGERLAVYKTKLNEINDKVEKGLGLKPIFEELKTIQAKFKDEPFTRGDRNKIWKNIDVLFKKVKEKKFGKQVDSGNQVSRLDRRFNGLMTAIDKMQRSIDRDVKDIEFQNKRVGQTDGQLEAQIRQAKIKMIEGRIDSKKEKLAEMLATKVDLEKKVAQEEKRQKVREEKKEVQKKKQEVKNKIAAEIAEKSQDVDAQKLEAAASKIKDGKKPKPKQKETLLGAIATVAGEAIEDMVDTVKAVGEVVGDKIEDKMEDMKETVEDIKEDIAETIDGVTESKDDSESKTAALAPEGEEKGGSVLAKGGLLGAAAAAGGLLINKIKDAAEDAKDAVEAKVEDAKESVSEKVEGAKDKVAEVKEDASDKVAEVKETVTEKTEAAGEDIKEEKSVLAKGGILGAAAAAGGLLVNKIKDSAEGLKDAVEDKVGDVKESIEQATSGDVATDGATKVSSEETLKEVEDRLGDSEEE